MQKTKEKLKVLLYYKYVDIDNPGSIVEEQKEFCENNNLTGRIFIGEEGLNGTVAGNHDDIENYKKFMRDHDLFSDIEFKESEAEEDPFNNKLKVKTRPEIVTLRHEANPEEGGEHVPPEEFKKMIENDDVVILDARNDYEYEVGKFKNAVTLPIKTFREFPEAVEKANIPKDKKVVMYCTGGIRCERASAVMKEKGYDEVYQLKGGIAKFGEKFPNDNESWLGTCFVFDNRFTIPINEKPKLISECKDCGEKDDTFRNCRNVDCNLLMLQCDSCNEEKEGFCSGNCKNNAVRTHY